MDVPAFYGFVVEDQDGSQALVREYMQGGQYIDEVIVVKTGGSYFYYMYDLRFNEYGFVNSTGTVVERAKYDGYGKRTLMDASYTTITTPIVNQSYGYTGIRHDSETSLQYYRARYFDNDQGRFINRDPIGYVDGLNLYNGYFIPLSFDFFGTFSSKVNYTKGIKKSGGQINAAYMGRTVPELTYTLKTKVKKGCCYIKSLKFKLNIDIYYAKAGDMIFTPGQSWLSATTPDYKLTSADEAVIKLHEKTHADGMIKYMSILAKAYEGQSPKCCYKSPNISKSNCEKYWTRRIDALIGNLNIEIDAQSGNWHNYNNTGANALTPIPAANITAYLTTVETAANTAVSNLGTECPFTFN